MKTRTKRLFDLLTAAGIERPSKLADVEVCAVSSDTRTLTPGALFVVVAGTQENGARYALAATAAGAVAVVAPEAAAEDLAGLDVPVVFVDDSRGALARLAVAFHDAPSQTLDVVGVTGTNGKTTTAHLLRGVLEASGRGPCALIGTIAWEWGDTVLPARNTTPGAAELQELLARSRDEAGCVSAAIEVSSHALDQRRAEGVHFAVGVFTNLTGDHLDYHRSMDAYAEAKARLFGQLGPEAVAVVNAEDDYTPTMLRDCAARVITYGIDRTIEADVTARDVEMTARGVEFTLSTPDGDASVVSPLLGRYNVLNLLAAAGAGLGLGLPVGTVAAGLSRVGGVRGRLESVDAGQDFAVLVDYAHTDDAVSNVLRNLRGVVSGRLLAVLGCGGDRDRTKRPRMARAAAELADQCWFTSDNPRTEDQDRIIADMLDGVWGARNVRVEVDRRTAIGLAVATARPGDCIAILGKGHEDYQVIGTTTVPFDDRAVARDALAAVRATPGSRPCAR